MNFLGNSPQDWAFFLIALGVIFFLLRLSKTVLIGRLSVLAGKTETQWDDLLVDVVKRKHPFFTFALALFAASHWLNLSEKSAWVIHKTLILAILAQGGIWISCLINFLVSESIKKTGNMDPGRLTAINAIKFLTRIAVWTTILLLSLDNLGFNITALVAGLGVGGIAVALAAQNILGDLFASLSIVLDRPFVIGDFIVVGDLKGAVEYVGLKTTRVRSLSGEEIIFSNTDLLQSRIRNFKRMFERRVDFVLGVTYETPYEKLQKIPVIIREAIEKQPNTRFDRAHFKNYGDFSLNFEAVYYFKGADYNPYMDCQQAINFEIFQRFAQEGIEFAYPTQTLHVKKT